jgi:hypothetical protein
VAGASIGVTSALVTIAQVVFATRDWWITAVAAAVIPVTVAGLWLVTRGLRQRAQALAVERQPSTSVELVQVARMGYDSDSLPMTATEPPRGELEGGSGSPPRDSGASSEPPRRTPPAFDRDDAEAAETREEPAGRALEESLAAAVERFRARHPGLRSEAERDREIVVFADQVVPVAAAQEERPRTPDSLWRQARRNIGAGAAALLVAVGAGIGAAIAADINSATRITHDPGPASSETCTQAEVQVAELARKDPHLARLYARHAAGLPRLVEPELEKRCGGHFDALLR